jgi:hypothetical protein
MNVTTFIKIDGDDWVNATRVSRVEKISYARLSLKDDDGHEIGVTSIGRFDPDIGAHPVIPAVPGAKATIADYYSGDVHFSYDAIIAWRIDSDGWCPKPVLMAGYRPEWHRVILLDKPDGWLWCGEFDESYSDLEDAKSNLLEHFKREQLLAKEREKEEAAERNAAKAKASGK